MVKRKYDDCFLKPEIKKAGEYQIFKMKGKDERGFDWQVRLSPVSEKTYPADIPATADCDRVELYAGSDPAKIEKISGEMEVTLGKEKEKHNITKSSLVYIPKGLPIERRIAKNPEQPPWVMTFNLTPKRDDAPEKGWINNTAGRKYEHLITDELLTPAFFQMNSAFLTGKSHFWKLVPGPTAQFAFYYVMKTGMFMEPPHSHKNDEWLMFISADPKDMKNLGATMEVAMGDDWEKYSFNYSTFIRFPKGVPHGPFFVRNLQRPFILGHFWAGGEAPHFDNVT
jgi:hypothetical protein